jgi:hypothetical protein
MIREVGKGPEKKSREAKLARRNKVLNDVGREKSYPLYRSKKEVSFSIFALVTQKTSPTN